MAAPSEDPSSTDNSSGTLLAWLQLVRFPNVFTVLADIGAAYLLVAGGPFPLARFVVVLLAGVCLYWSGMVLNDVFDIEKDKAERSKRPLASGAISLGQARAAGWSLLILGVALAAVSGYLPDDSSSATWLPAALATGLAVLIVAYDGPLKSTALAPAAMGGCRVLSFLLGASPVLPLVNGSPAIPHYILCVAMGFGVYIMGITTIARDEALGGHRVNLRVGFVVMVIGAVILAKAPELAQPVERALWKVKTDNQFPLLIALIVFPVIARGFRMQLNGDGKAIGNTIRAGIMTMIPLAAAYAMLGAGPYAALSIFALLIPAMVLSMRLRVT